MPFLTLTCASARVAWAQQPDVVILCTSILSLEAVLRSFPVERLRRSTLVADVLSVKVFPKNLFLATLPPSLDIVCLHPMFGPESGKGSWNSLPLVFDRVRVRVPVCLEIEVRQATALTQPLPCVGG